jgi:hypothetical protein
MHVQPGCYMFAANVEQSASGCLGESATPRSRTPIAAASSSAAGTAAQVAPVVVAS